MTQVKSSIEKKVVRSSNLALRFYKKDGWTQDELDEIAPKGDAQCASHEDVEPYFIFTNESRVEVDRVLEHCSKLIRAYNDYPAESDREFMLRLL